MGAIIGFKSFIFFSVVWARGCLKKSLSLSTDNAKASGLVLSFVDVVGNDSGSESFGFAIALEWTDLIVVEGQVRIASIAADHVSLGVATGDTAACFRRRTVSIGLDHRQAAVDRYRSWLAPNCLVYFD